MVGFCNWYLVSGFNVRVGGTWGKHSSIIVVTITTIATTIIIIIIKGKHIARTLHYKMSSARPVGGLGGEGERGKKATACRQTQVGGTLASSHLHQQRS